MSFHLRKGVNNSGAAGSPPNCIIMHRKGDIDGEGRGEIHKGICTTKEKSSHSRGLSQAPKVSIRRRN